MRSRYSAYALAKRNDQEGHAMLRYLLATWHISTSPGEIELGPTQWMGLEVLYAQEVMDAAVVEFIAHCKVNGKAEKMHEISRFVRVDGAWKYIDGDVTG
jgi:SEC-C motif domain protein